MMDCSSPLQALWARCTGQSPGWVTAAATQDVWAADGPRRWRHAVSLAGYRPPPASETQIVVEKKVFITRFFVQQSSSLKITIKSSSLLGPFTSAGSNVQPCSFPASLLVAPRSSTGLARLGLLVRGSWGNNLLFEPKYHHHCIDPRSYRHRAHNVIQ